MRHRPMTLRRVGTALLVPVALGLAACGNDAEPDAGQDTSAVGAEAGDEESDSPDTKNDGKTDSADEAGSGESDSARNADDASSGDRAAVGQGKAGDPLTPADFADIVDAAFDRATTARVTVVNDLEALRSETTGAVDFTGDSPLMQIQMTGGPLGDGTTADIRLLEDGMYMNSGFSGGKFVKVPAEQIAATGVDLSSIDPSSTARRFAESASEVTYRGVEQVDGEALHRYSLQLDSAALKAGGGSKGAAPKQIDYDMWFDDAGLIRRVSTDLGDLGTTVATYSQWGKPVTIVAPPPGDVMEMPDLPTAPQS